MRLLKRHFVSPILHPITRHQPPPVRNLQTIFLKYNKDRQTNGLDYGLTAVSKRVCSSSEVNPAATTSSIMSASQRRPSSDLAAFRRLYDAAQRIVVLTGAGVSAESGVPTFRGAGGLWRRWSAMDLATPQAFNRDPSLVWEFYHYRREVMASKSPNPAHEAISRAEAAAKSSGKSFAVITQNIDGLHARAGTDNILELHGNLFKTRCTRCGDIRVNKDSPICEALRDKGAPEPNSSGADIPIDQLPRCSVSSCGGLLRPHVIWFGESLESAVMDEAEDLIGSCDICLVVGTSSVVYPAAMFAPSVAARGVPVAEFNVEETPVTNQFGFCFVGPAGQTLPDAINPQ